MRATRVAMGAGILMVAIGVVGVAAGPATIAALAQGAPPGGASGMGMMGGPFTASARPVSAAQAIEVLRQWPVAHHLDDLVLDEVEAYTVNYYGQFKERSTGRAAVQVLVDRYTGGAMPEMGPNMMWNTKYGQAMMQEMMGGMGMMGGGMMGGGMMGGGMGSPGMMGTPAPQTGTTASVPQLSSDQARRAADQFLSGFLPGAAVGDGDAFYGYYHFDVMRGGRQVGMLSVNATTGQVWYHTWHGEFLQKQEVR